MKKSLALILTFVVILTCFAACKKEGQLEGGIVATNAKGQVVAAVVTQENGRLQRDEAGNNAVVIVTDANGTTLK